MDGVARLAGNSHVQLVSSLRLLLPARHVGGGATVRVRPPAVGETRRSCPCHHVD